MMNHLLPTIAPVVLAVLLPGLRARGEDLALIPSSFTLHGPEARHQVLVEEVLDGVFVAQVTGAVELTVNPAGVVRVERAEDGTFVASPIANGKAMLTVRVGPRLATAEVTVAGVDTPVAWSFRNHVQPVLTKAKCNSGACHGAAAGKNGFKLSLRGYDAAGDFLTLTRQARGRRIVPVDPGRSLVLTKSTGLIAHKGGVLFETDSLEYEVLSRWIASGTPAPRPDDPRIERLEILPSAIVLSGDAEQQLIVRAYFSDGRVEDVTHWAKFTATRESVTRVDDRGKVKVVGRGQSAITAWYLSKIVVATVSVPYQNDVAPEVFESSPRRNFIDDLVLEKLRLLDLPPSPPAEDREFLRRAFVDTIGVLPTAMETKAFFEDPSEDRKDRLIDALLERPEFVDFWTYRWSDLLLVNSSKIPKPAAWAYYRWIRDRVEANTPWDEFVRGIITASGDTLENGAANFFILHRDPLDMAETASVAFLGMSIQCARCHDHPLEKWTNGQYYRMANLFARVRTKDAQGSGNSQIFASASGDVIQPLTGKVLPPTPLDGEPLDVDDPRDRREHLAAWLTAPANPYFGRAIANRVWANFMGVGLVEAVDDLRLTNPASNDRLLGALAAYLVDQQWDLRSLMRVILRSATYQRTSVALVGNREDQEFYSRYYPRRMMAEVLLDAVSQVTGVPTAFPGFPSGWRALQLPDSNVASYFLNSFGRPDRIITCECERTAEPSMAQILHLANGDTINAKLRAAKNVIDRALVGKKTNEAIIDDLYLGALTRYPGQSEKKKLLGVLASVPQGQRREAIEDLYWSVLSSREFLFNH